ncbi:MAG: hypothetical protein IH613_07695 [Desulfuromonadales bacterium]|nr:hypothetical protein [Desulfuromonadales bacterium]
MKLYAGIDLHSTNSYVAIIDESGKRIFKEKLPNDIATITEKLSLYSGTLEGAVIESTYNWYWLVDGLMAYPEGEDNISSISRMGEPVEYWW